MKLYKPCFSENDVVFKDVSYKLINFSDSQRQIILEGVEEPGFLVKIVSRMSWEDLQNIILAVKALRNVGTKKIHLEVPYFLGARSDRLFEKGSTHYLKDIICPIINSLELNSVSVLDTHSNVLEGCLTNYEELDIKPFYGWFIEEAVITAEDKRNTFLISPDYGAIKRVNLFAKEYNFEKVLNCSKIRDIKTGKILDTFVPIIDFGGKNCIVIDDICDGGATFVDLAKQLKSLNAGNVTLLVTHGIFSKGFELLYKYIDDIYVTNSVNDFSFLSNEKGFSHFYQYKVI